MDPSLTWRSHSAPVWTLGLLFVVNGVVAPITEELACSGVIGTALAESSATWLAIVLTALGFVLKHPIFDMAAPLFGVTSLVLIAFPYCGLRARYGTASSTAAHLTGNPITTAPILLA